MPNAKEKKKKGGQNKARRSRDARIGEGTKRAGAKADDNRSQRKSGRSFLNDLSTR